MSSKDCKRRQDHVSSDQMSTRRADGPPARWATPPDDSNLSRRISFSSLSNHYLPFDRRRIHSKATQRLSCHPSFPLHALPRAIPDHLALEASRGNNTFQLYGRVCPWFITTRGKDRGVWGMRVWKRSHSLWPYTQLHPWEYTRSHQGPCQRGKDLRKRRYSRDPKQRLQI